MIKPTVHLNGTSKEQLFEGWYKAYQAVRDALTAVQNIPFNARDYYVQGNDAVKMATLEYAGLCRELNEIKEKLDEVVESLE